MHTKLLSIYMYMADMTKSSDILNKTPRVQKRRGESEAVII